MGGACSRSKGSRSDILPCRLIAAALRSAQGSRLRRSRRGEAFPGFWKGSPLLRGKRSGEFHDVRRSPRGCLQGADFERPKETRDFENVVIVLRRVELLDT